MEFETGLAQSTKHFSEIVNVIFKGLTEDYDVIEINQSLRPVEATENKLHQPLKCWGGIKVDASTTGVGAVLSQRQGNPSTLHPCTFFSKKLSPAEQNYDVGNRELLAIKLALEEWRHWLEGATHPFEVITDHRNLEYLRDAKRLNTRQARWSLFFTRFNFTVSYRPGSKNIKADSLSQLYQPDSIPAPPETILPPAVIVSPIQWSLDDHIAEATLAEPAPPGGPEGRTYTHLKDY
ncbi:hypothetical protein PO909_012935 [Leuciscus waleckii]